MENINTLSKKQIIGIVGVVLLMVGLGISVYLIQKQQIFKSRASGGNYINAFEIKDANGNIIQCDGSTTPPTCTTNTLDIKVRVKDTAPLLPQ